MKTKKRSKEYKPVTKSLPVNVQTPLSPYPSTYSSGAAMEPPLPLPLKILPLLFLRPLPPQSPALTAPNFQKTRHPSPDWTLKPVPPLMVLSRPVLAGQLAATHPGSDLKSSPLPASAGSPCKMALLPPRSLACLVPRALLPLWRALFPPASPFAWHLGTRILQ